MSFFKLKNGIMEDKKGEYNYAIEQRDVDFNGKSTYIALMNYVLQAAGDDADRLGFGIKDLNCDNCSWVLSRVAAQFGRRLEQGAHFTIRTWVNEVNRMMTTRNMVVTDSENNFVVDVVTQWAIIDLDKRTALDIRSLLDYENVINSEVSPIEKPKRIHKIEPQQSIEHRVVYSDIDFNRHVNAMKYLEWMFDMIPLEQLDTSALKRMDINFLHEARYGESLKVGVESVDSISTFEVKNGEDLVLCRVVLEWD